MSRPLLLDLFCGIGGSAVGYARAGFEVIGIDNEAQPDYPFPFIQADFRSADLSWIRRTFDAVHASPPCAAYTAIGKQNATRGVGQEHPRFYEASRALLDDVGLPYVIENPAARPDVVLCGEMFGLAVLRHRRFELGGWHLDQPQHRAHRGRVRGWRHGEYSDGPYLAVYGSGGGKATLPEAQEALGIGWSDSLPGIVQALPPAYTECIGHGLMRHVDTAGIYARGKETR